MKIITMYVRQPKPSIMQRIEPYKSRITIRRTKQVMKSRTVKRLLSTCVIMIAVGCAMELIPITVFAQFMSPVLPVFGAAGNLESAFATFKTIGNIIIKGFQALGMTICLIGFFKELTGHLLHGDKGDIGGSVFRYAIGFAMFFLMPLLLIAIAGAFGS